MWRIVLVIAAVACGGSRSRPTTPPLVASGPPLPAPPPVDPAARGASYLARLARQIQPAWAQFLEDCRLRLPSDHPLNRRELVAVAELAIDDAGRVVQRIVSASGNGDFDTAVFDVLGDASPVPPPPAELRSDDDRVHVHWLFARDSRQAGPRTAKVVELHLPLLGVVDRLLARSGRARDLARVARRIAATPDDPDRLAATERLMIAVLRDALDSPNGAARRAAVEAIGRAKLHVLAPEVHPLAGPISDVDLRIVAIAASASLGDPAVAPALAVDLEADLAQRPRIALAKIDALVALGRAVRARDAIRAAVANGPTREALAALALAPDPELAARLPGWFATGDARTRAAVCDALPAAARDAAPRLIARGLRDPAASVRAACIDAAVRVDRGARPRPSGLARRLRELARDRDHSVRARAIAALGRLDPGHRLRAITDPSAEVRLASVVGAPESELRVLAGDREPDVRAAALAALGDRASDLVARGAADLSAAVRRAVIPIAPEAVLARLVADPSPDVATAALVELAERRGRAATITPFLADLVASPAHGPERVRIALAWLLAR